MQHSSDYRARPRKRLALWRLAAAIWRPSQKRDPAPWAAAHRIYPETAGIPGPRDPGLTPYMVPWSAAVHRGGYRRVVAVTSAQSGKTDSMLDIIGARLDQRPAPILYVGPTKEFLTDQFEPRLMALLDEAETLSHKVVRGRRMKKTLKHVAGVRLRLAHAGSSTALKSDPAALALIDEYDEMMANVKGQGDVLGLVERDAAQARAAWEARAAERRAALARVQVCGAPSPQRPPPPGRFESGWHASRRACVVSVCKVLKPRGGAASLCVTASPAAARRLAEAAARLLGTGGSRGAARGGGGDRARHGARAPARGSGGRGWERRADAARGRRGGARPSFPSLSLL